MNFSRPRMLRTPLTSFSACMSNSSKSSSHYDTLQVGHDATQEEIKTAYYKLTKQYHPDVNKTEEAKGKFRNVAEAYEILGNYKARKQYDRGIIARGTTRSTYKEEKEHPHMAFYKSRMNQYPKPVRTADSKIYDFDAWIRAHYGYTFKRTINKKRSNEEAKMTSRDIAMQEGQTAKEIGLTIGLICIIVFAIIFSEARDNFDIVIEKNKEKTEKGRKL